VHILLPGRGMAYLRWPVVCMSAILVSLLLLTSCSNSATIHQTYSYTTLSQPTPEAAIWRPGDHMRLRWQGQPDSSTIDGKPAQIIINAQIIGPFQSLNAINHAITSDGVGIDGPTVAATKPVHTDNWTNQTYTAVLNLPGTLSPGYYVLVQSVQVNKSDGTVKGSTRMNFKVSPG
jgi:hypothetical protein